MPKFYPFVHSVVELRGQESFVRKDDVLFCRKVDQEDRKEDQRWTGKGISLEFLPLLGNTTLI